MSVQDAKTTREPTTVHRLPGSKGETAKKTTSAAGAKKPAAKKTASKGKPRRSA